MNLLTIIITVFNTNQKYLDILFQSINKNNLEDVSVLVVDNGSSNHEVISYLRKKCRNNNFKLLRLEQNAGISGGRNYGLENAESKFIWFVDSDDEIYPGAIDLIKINLRKTISYDFYSYNFKIKKNDDVYNSTNDYAVDLYDGKKIYCKGAVWNKIYSIPFLKKNNIQFSTLNIDHEDEAFFWLVLFYANNNFISFDDSIYIYNRSNENCESNKFSILKSYKAISTYLDEYYDIIKKPISDDFRIYFLHFLSLFYVLINKDSIKFTEWNKNIRAYRKYIWNYYKSWKKIVFSFCLSNYLFRYISYNGIKMLKWFKYKVLK